MKISSERRIFQGVLFALIQAFLILFVTSCQNTNPADAIKTELTGTWHQISRSVNGVSLTKDSTRMLMQINANQICILCDSTTSAIKSKSIIDRSGWSYTNGLFNLAIDLPASWTPTVTPTTLQLERNDFTSTGQVSKTILSFERVSNISIQ